MVEKIVNTLLFKPPFPTPYDFPARVFRLRTKAGNEISATYLRRKGASVTILFSHGNAEDLNSCYSWMRRLSRELHVNVLGYDYSGYGSSTGEMKEDNCYADIEAVFNYLVNQKGLFPHQIVLYGRSLGSGPSCYLAQKTALENRSVGGLILHSPFASVYRVVVDVGFTMKGDKFPNIDRIGDVACPVMIAHGREDTVVPFKHGEELYATCPKDCRASPFWMAGIGHNDHGAAVEAELMRRLNEYLDYHILARRLYLRASRSAPMEHYTRAPNKEELIRLGC
uniref:AB hydrolase-1 domain-containing protein n=1 Tax=Grammatophora oceanica TaxID=210454 RepID=A0A7S1VS05_9STRA|mmetsp:Transcript_5665/g.7952  ORF Transcript_5665/g.7952 Transcript_5665/m.7952 type:complete len:282 (+) Transcript_5665:148-993(+)